MATFISLDKSEFKADFTCPICMDIMYKPMSITCGHNFCNNCISQEKNNQCPTCRTVYIKPTDCNKILSATIQRIFPDEYNARAVEIAAEEVANDQSNMDVYSEVYRRLSERARLEYRNGPPPAFDRFVEALSCLREKPEHIMRVVSWYNQKIRYALLALLFAIAFDVDSLSVGIVIFMVAMGALFDFATPILLNWINYGEGVFRMMTGTNNQNRNLRQRNMNFMGTTISADDIIAAANEIMARLLPDQMGAVQPPFTVAAIPIQHQIPHNAPHQMPHIVPHQMPHIVPHQMPHNAPPAMHSPAQHMTFNDYFRAGNMVPHIYNLVQNANNDAGNPAEDENADENADESADENAPENAPESAPENPSE